jgi:hypothetical protein
MKVEDFKTLMETQFYIIRATDEEKRKYYAPEENRLCHFVDTGNMKKETPERALWGMWSKHIIATMYMIYDLDKGIIPSEAILEELIKDNVLYPILLKGLIKDRIGG